MLGCLSGNHHTASVLDLLYTVLSDAGYGFDQQTDIIWHTKKNNVNSPPAFTQCSICEHLHQQYIESFVLERQTCYIDSMNVLQKLDSTFQDGAPSLSFFTALRACALKSFTHVRMNRIKSFTEMALLDFPNCIRSNWDYTKSYSEVFAQE